MLAPIVLFVYNRPEHTIKTIEALSKNELAKESKIYIYSDAPRNDKQLKNVNLVRDYIDSLNKFGYFKSVSIKKAAVNKGLAESVINGVTEIINQYGKVIVLEDDLITSPQFLNFMNKSLDFYRNEKKVFSISGYSNIKIPSEYQDNIYFSHISTSWGWSTWKEEWNSIIWENQFYDKVIEDKKFMKKVKKKIGNQRIKMLHLQVSGKIDSWAVRRLFTQLIQKKFTAFPSKTLVKNIGHDGSGTHSGKNEKYDMDNKLSKDDLFSKVEFSENININNIIYKKNNTKISKKIINLVRRKVGAVLNNDGN